MKKAQLTRFICRMFLQTAFSAALLFLFHGICAAQEQASLKVAGAEGTDIGGSAPVKNCRIVFLGFVGALEPSNNKYSGVVQIRKTLQEKQYSDICANSFSPYAWTDGRDWLLTHFPSHPGPLTPEELQQSPKVILVGHSMGGWAMLSVARELRSRDIPVELTIQVDSVGITDYTIPRNVKSAAIFHANDVLMFMTTKHLRREDPYHTKVVADVTVAGAGHESITRDPRIRQLVLETVEKLRAAVPFYSLPVATHAIPQNAPGSDRQ